MPKKILVVDDEPHIVRLVEINLMRVGYEVVCAYDGVEALEKVASERPDLITLNVMMPRMDGWEVMEHLQANPETKDIPVIFLTGQTTDADIFKGWGLGCKAYLTKPLNPRELLNQVSAALDSSVSSDNESWRV